MIMEENFHQWQLRLQFSTLNLIGIDHVDLHPLGYPYNENNGHIMGFDHLWLQDKWFSKSITL